MISAERLGKVVDGLQALINYNDRDVFLTARVRPAIALLSELRAQGLSQEDTARMDFLEQYGSPSAADCQWRCNDRLNGATFREAIDAAILRRLVGQTT